MKRLIRISNEIYQGDCGPGYFQCNRAGKCCPIGDEEMIPIQ